PLNQSSNRVHVGRGRPCLRSRMRTPSSALPAWPHGFVEGRGRLLADAAVCFGASFTTFLSDFFAAALVFGLLFLRIVIVRPLRVQSMRPIISCESRFAG